MGSPSGWLEAGQSRLGSMILRRKEGRIIQAGTIFFCESKIKEGTRPTTARCCAHFPAQIAAPAFLVCQRTKDQNVCCNIPLALTNCAGTTSLTWTVYALCGWG